MSLTAETDLGTNLVGPIEAKPFNASTGHVNGPFGRPNQQIDWLINDLRRVNRQKTPWVVVFIHRPWYCSSGCEPGVAWQQAFEKILYDNSVDLVAHGHVHNYEVFAPIYNGWFNLHSRDVSVWLMLRGSNRYGRPEWIQQSSRADVRSRGQRRRECSSFVSVVRPCGPG